MSQLNLLNACTRTGLDEKTTNKIWGELEKENKSKFNIENLAYYFGAIIIMSAMGWFMTDAWDSIEGLGISLLGTIYFLVFMLVGRYWWFHKKLFILGGLLVTVAIWMVPLIVFGVEKHTGLWSNDIIQDYRDHGWIRGSWIIMEIAVIVVGIITLRFIRFPFLTFPIAFALWYLSLDLTPFFMGDAEFTWEQKQEVSVFFGLAMLLCSYFIDRRTKEDFAFWGYLFGLFAFWGGLSLMDTGNELSRLFYCIINIFLILFSVIIQRRVFLIFGSTGVFIYLMDLASIFFENTLLFPVALSFLGIMIMFLGVIYNRNKEKIELKITKWLPSFLLNLNPEKREL